MPFALSLASEVLILASNSVRPCAPRSRPSLGGRLVAIYDAGFGKTALLQIISEDRIIGETGLETTAFTSRRISGMVS